jgi:hypothetical protein
MGLKDTEQILRELPSNRKKKHQNKNSMTTQKFCVTKKLGHTFVQLILLFVILNF